MGDTSLITNAKNTWCSGCGNFAILNAIKAVFGALIDEGTPREDIVMVSGIGCHAKIADYINVNSFYSLHGRVVPVCEAIKLANPKLKVIGFAGDGDTYGEGLEHLVFAAKRNVDISIVIHNNSVYGLTTGQYTPTSPLGFKGRSTPGGTKELPMNPLELMLASHASFIARGYSHGIELLKKMLKEAITHKGFSLVDILQVCVTFYNMYENYNARVYELKDHDPSDGSRALEKIKEWDYNSDAKIPLGVFYKKERPVFEFPPKIKEIDLDAKIKGLLNDRA
ncbi:MAG: thiamine pyrophosphate-dependent enzyme [Candidatus Omnitrophota bacterium]|nr:thiamine pyrophosphate-dependent enzyme [Candidatus Omnitrophota bacterium]